MIRKLLNKPITSLVFLLFLTQGLLAQFPGSPVSFQRQEVSEQKVQLALLLDASGSMKKYLDQAQGELWYTVNEILSAYEGYATPQLEIAIMVHGFRQAGRRNDFIYTLVPFTTDLDWAASELYKIETGGSIELPIRAVNTAVKDLKWSFKSGDLKFLFIAGNEKFAQGNWEMHQMKQAKAADISINTIFAGSYFKGVKKLWKAAAVYGQGEYFALEQPNQDRWNHQPGYNRDYIARLNRGLYDTYLPYGSYGNTYWDRYCYLDDYAWDYGYDSYYWRIYYKTQVNYYNPQWDLVDAIYCGYTTWDDIDDDDIPQDIRDLDLDDRNALVEALWKRRQNILNDIRTYGSSQAPAGSLSGNTGHSGGGTVGSFQEAIDKAVRKKVQSSDAVLLKPADIYTPPIPGIGEPGKDREVLKKKVAPKSSGDVGINPQTTVLRQENPAIQAAPISPGKRVVNTVNKPHPPATPRQENPVKPQKTTEINQAPVGSITQQKQEDQKVQAVQIQADQARAIELQKIEKAKQDKIVQDQLIREQQEKERIAKERQARVAAQQAADREQQQQLAQDRAEKEKAERERIERQRQARIAAQQAAEREQQQQLAQDRAEKEKAERERTERQRQARIAAQQAAERERQQQIAQERDERERENRERAERERQERVAAQRSAERERQQQVSREREERAQRERQERAHAQRAAERERQQQQARQEAQRERQARAAAERAQQERASRQAKEAAKRQEVQKKSQAPKPSSSKSVNKSGRQAGKIK